MTFFEDSVFGASPFDSLEVFESVVDWRRSVSGTPPDQKQSHERDESKLSQEMAGFHGGGSLLGGRREP